MFSQLLMAALLLAPTISQTQKNQAPVTPQKSPLIGNAPPIKMGLWEATTTTSTSKVFKTRSCVTPQSYREMLTRMPPNCALSNQTNSGTSITEEVSCTASNGNVSTGHVSVQIPDSGTAHSTMTLSATEEGHTMTLTVVTDSHFVSADCGDIAPGVWKDIE